MALREMGLMGPRQDAKNGRSLARVEREGRNGAEQAAGFILTLLQAQVGKR